jgi:V-ATPase subunit H
MAKEKKGEDNRLVHRLQKILSNPSGYDVSSYDAAARILAVILTTCPDKTVLFLEQQKTLMNFILGQLGSGKQDDKELLSPLVIVVSLGQLFLAPKIAEMFIKCGGIDYLVRYLSIYGGDLPISYYTLIALWLLSYEPSASKYFYDPEVISSG